MSTQQMYRDAVMRGFGKGLAQGSAIFWTPCGLFMIAVDHHVMGGLFLVGGLCGIALWVYSKSRRRWPWNGPWD